MYSGTLPAHVPDTLMDGCRLMLRLLEQGAPRDAVAAAIYSLAHYDRHYEPEDSRSLAGADWDAKRERLVMRFEYPNGALWRSEYSPDGAMRTYGPSEKADD